MLIKELKNKIEDHTSQLAEMDTQKADKTVTANLQTQVNNMALQGTSGDSSAEVAQARGIYPVLNDRFNSVENATVKLCDLKPTSSLNLQWYKQGVLQTGSGYKLTYYDISDVSEVFLTGINYSYRDIITLLDINKNPLSYIYNNTASDITYTNYRIDVSSAYYIALTQFKVDNLPVLKRFMKSDEILNLEQNSLTDYTTLTTVQLKKGYYRRGGEWVSDTNYTTGVYNIDGLNNIIITGKNRLYSNIYTLFDENDIVLDYMFNDSIFGTTYAWNIDLKVYNAKKVAISTHNSDGGLSQVSVKAKYFLKQYSQILKPIIDDINANNFAYIMMKWVRTELKSYQNSTEYAPLNLTSNVYDVSSLDLVKVKVNESPYINGYTLFNGTTIIGYHYNNTANANSLEEVINVSEATELWVTVDRGHEQYTGSCSKLEYVNGLNQWKDKTIGWWGTSIPASGIQGYNHPESYPSIVGNLLGANVVNHAVGESSIHCKDYTRINPTTNPYGFGTDFRNCARCLTNTIVEMQWIIDNFNGGAFTTNVPASLTQADKDLILSCSYENRLLPYLNTTDLFVFDHGHNDLSDTGNHAYDSLVATYGVKNLYSYVGGMNFIMDIIKKNNPRARVIQISEYDYGSNKYGVDKQRKFAELHGIPFFELYKMTGWSSSLTYETTGYWGTDGYWVTSGGTLQNLTIRQMHLKDDLHPHSDKSNKSAWFLAEIIEKWLRNQVA